MKPTETGRSGWVVLSAVAFVWSCLRSIGALGEALDGAMESVDGFVDHDVDPVDASGQS